MTARQHAKRILTHCKLQPDNMGDHLVMGIQVAMNEAIADAQDMLAEAERQVGIAREALEKVSACEASQGLYASELAKDAIRRLEGDLAVV